MAPGVMMSYSHPLSKTKHFQSTWCQESSEYCHFLPFTSLISLPWQMVAAFLFTNSMIDEVLNCVCRRIVNYRGAISVKIILWMGSFSFQGSSVFSSQFLCLSPPNKSHIQLRDCIHVLPCNRPETCPVGGRWFRQHRGTATGNQPAAGAQRYETSASVGFLLSVVGPSVISRYTLLLPSGSVQRSKQYLHKDISTTGWAKRTLHQ